MHIEYIRKPHVKTFISLIPYITALFLFIIPFFWLKPGEMDIGGDSNRLYFYDPLSYLKNVTLYAPEPVGTAHIGPVHYLLPISLLLYVLKYFFSSTVLIEAFYGIDLSVGFLSMYLIIKELLKHTQTKLNNYIILTAGVISALFYIHAMGSAKIIDFWYRAIASHTQVFINPLMFLLVMKFLLYRQSIYLWVALLVSVVFAHNFGLTSAPPFFAFFPLSLLFLVIYVVLIKKQAFPFKTSLIGVLLFLGLQAFQLLPQFISLFDPESMENGRFFDKELIVHEGVRYFTAVLYLGQATFSFLAPSPVISLQWVGIFAPLIVVGGFIYNQKIKKDFIFVAIFFLITFFLVTANIGNIGPIFYKSLFYLPGFSIFRNFYSQWAYVFFFFYSLLLSLSLFVLLSKAKLKYAITMVCIIVVCLLVELLPFLRGDHLHSVNRNSNNVKVVVTMDPVYEETLQFIKSMPDNGKILTLPLSDYYHQTIYGTNNGAYQGPSTIGNLTGKNDFAGYQNLSPFTEELMRLSRNKEYDKILQIFSLLSIRYIYYNSDPKVYEEKFPDYPYTYMLTSLPKTQKEYQEFLRHFPIRQIYSKNSYHIYELDKKVIRPEIYVPDSIDSYNSVPKENQFMQPIMNKKISYQSSLLHKDTCQQPKFSPLCSSLYRDPKLTVEFTKIDPTDYKLHINGKKPTKPFLLIFQNSYSKAWKLLLQNNSPVSEERHIEVNGYANGWLLTPDEFDSTVRIKLGTQRFFIYGAVISLVSLFILFLLIGKSVINITRVR
jgi:hypothetical protein